jgi:hypothetical protein
MASTHHIIVLEEVSKPAPLRDITFSLLLKEKQLITYNICPERNAVSRSDRW